MTISDLKENGLIIMECISGSKAYGLDTVKSDTDIKGVFIMPKKQYYGLKYIEQISNESSDVVYYELGRYLELLFLNNPNILELLNTPSSAIIYKHPILDKIKSEIFLSKLCKETFGKFALSQIKKAKGLKKKIVNPISSERKSILSFCHINYKDGSLTLLDFFKLNQWDQGDCGLVNISNMKDVYGLYYGKGKGYKGIIVSEESNDVKLSSIPKGETQIGLLYFNKDGYSIYCKEYREYWDWVNKRNEERYQNTKSHGKSYDSKNMMHTFRLLEMAIEIGNENTINVRRPNREFLLNIKNGKFKYEELMKMADDRKADMENAFSKSSLPESPNFDQVNSLAYNLRNEFYRIEKFQ